MKLVRRLVKSAYFSLVLGIILMVCGLLAGLETFVEDFVNIDIHSHHGMIIFGFGQALRSLADILEGAEGVMVTEVAEEIEDELSI